VDSGDEYLSRLKPAPGAGSVEVLEYLFSSEKTWESADGYLQGSARPALRAGNIAVVTHPVHRLLANLHLHTS
jgi:hypothetical protein